MKKNIEKEFAAPRDYECRDLGPIRIERSGRMIRMRSHWDPSEFEQFKKEVSERRPKFKEEINERVCQLKSLIRQYNPLDLLSCISWRHCFGRLDECNESEHKKSEVYAEYAQSLILSSEYKPGLGQLTEEVLEKINNEIVSIHYSVASFFGTELAEDTCGRIEQDIRHWALVSRLFLRGDSYPEHHWEMMGDISRDHDQFFHQHYGIHSASILKAFELIETQVLDNLDRRVEAELLETEIHESWKALVDKEGINNLGTVKDSVRKHKTLPGIAEKYARANELHDWAQRSPFVVIPTPEIPVQLLERLSCQFGDNSCFATFEKSPGWPTNDSVVHERPLIMHDEQFYCFVPQLLFRNTQAILERWIRDKDKDTQYWDGKYAAKRHEFLVAKALEYLGKLLPGSESYSNLFYHIEENGGRKRPETDGLVMYDENLFIIEAKAESYGIRARRGDLPVIKEDLKRIIDRAYQQALRTKQYIEATPQPVFEQADGTRVLTIDDKKKYRNIYLVNITLEMLGPLACQLSILKSLNLLEGKEWPWSVFVNDLRAISEIMESPSEFLHYLQNRLKTNERPTFQADDELNLLMYYLNEGLDLEDGRLDGATAYKLSFLKPPDRYYDYKAGRSSSGEKPRSKVPEPLRQFISMIEKTGKLGFSRVTTALMNLDRRDQEAVATCLGRFTDVHQNKVKLGAFLPAKKGSGLGLSLWSVPSWEHDTWGEINADCRMQMYREGIKCWIAIAIDRRLQSIGKIDFAILEAEQEYTKKAGRNDPCPCGSGRKFKKCCGG